MTPRQRQLVEFIRARQALGEHPSQEEMRAALNLKSVNRVRDMLTALRKEGVIGRRLGRTRDVVILPALPDEAAVALVARAAGSMQAAERIVSALRADGFSITRGTA